MGQTLATLGVLMDRVTLSVPAEAAFHGTLRLVVGGLGTRSQLSYEEVNELQLSVESLVAHRAPVGERIQVEASLDGGTVSLAVGPFVPDEDAGGRRVVERLVRSARVVRRPDSGEWVELRAGGAGDEGQRAP